MSEVQTQPATKNDRDIHPPGERPRPASDLVGYCQQYAHEKPKVVALWCLGIGFVLGWKLKLW